MELTQRDYDMLMSHARGPMKVWPSEVEDLVQDTMLKAHRAIERGSYTEQGQRNWWLIRILKNNYINLWRKIKKQEEKDELVQIYFVQAETKEVYQTHFDANYEPEIQAFLDEIPQGMVDVLLLRAEGFEYLEIAEKLDIPVGTVMSRLYRARKKFIESSGLECMQDYWDNFPPDEEDYLDKWENFKPKAKVEVHD